MIALLAAVGSLVAPAQAVAGTAKAEMSVTVSVIGRAVITIDNAPASINVTADDIARGYVDVAMPMTVNVRTNSRSGYLLTVRRFDGAFTSVDLDFGSSHLRVAAEEGLIARPWVAQGDTLSVNTRLTLAPGTEAGNHAIPFAITASPL